ncbi:MAG: hypothetical protein JO356_02195 [Acidobacteria bacterium]|nr:hypothetical protein [Acidobacteriota bacterium]
MTTERKFARVAQILLQDPDVRRGEGKGFGAGALKIQGKIFAMISSKNQFVVKLSKDRVNQLIALGIGERFEPRPGKAMKEWLAVKAEGANWVKLAKEASEFVKRDKP